MTQKKVLQILKTGANVFITGEPGSGKTFVINEYTKWLKEERKKFAVTASTGIAATHINGTTIHSFSGIGIKDVITDADLAVIMTKDFLVKKILEAQVLIIDEISMLSAQTLNNVDLVLRRVRNGFFETKPFGGMQVIFVGDFFQLPPITSPGKPKAEFAFEATSWKEAEPTVCYITEQHRQSDKPFLKILTAMRSGTMTEAYKDELKMTSSKGSQPLTKLYTHNLNVDRINDAELLKIDGEEREYKMESSGIPFLIDTLKKQCLSPELLVLRVGAIVMFTKNNFEDGYVNGSLGTISGYTNDGMPLVQLKKGGEPIIARYAEWAIEDTKAAISQVPLRLAWAITVHKSQGMSLDAASIDLSRAFEYGQGYVAISRVRTLDGLYLEGMNDKAIEMHPRVVEQDAWFRHLSSQNE